MNYSIQKVCSQLLRISNKKQILNITNNYLLRSSNNLHPLILARSVITRPKELDVLRKKSKKSSEDDRSGYNTSSKAPEEPIGAYGYFLFTLPIITFGLGVWQIIRREWKLNLLKELETRLHKEPVELPENLDDLAQLEYCPIKVIGEFLHDKEFVVGPRSLIVDGHGATEGKGNLISGSHLNRGYNVITPFKVENRELVLLVNRGWLPNKYKHEEERKKSHIEGTIEITGINRLSENRPQFGSKNEPNKGHWHYRNVYEMAEIANTDPIFLDMVESFPGPDMPIGSQTRVNLRNEHLSYVVTWFGLSAFTGWYWIRMFIQKKPIF